MLYTPPHVSFSCLSHVIDVTTALCVAQVDNKGSALCVAQIDDKGFALCVAQVDDKGSALCVAQVDSKGSVLCRANLLGRHGITVMCLAIWCTLFCFLLMNFHSTVGECGGVE